MSDQKNLTSKISPILLASNPPGITARRRGQSESAGPRSVDSPTLGTGNGHLRRTNATNSSDRRQNGRGFTSFFSSYGSGKRSNKTSNHHRLVDPEAGSPSILDDRGSNFNLATTERDYIDGDSVISASGSRFHGYDMVGEPHSTPIAVLPKVCSVDSIPRELEEFAQTHNARELLIDAAFNQDDRTVKNLLINSFRHPLSPSENFELGATLLIAAWNGQASLVQYLVAQCGSDLTFADQTGRTALHLAALSGSAETVAVLVHAGAPVNAWDKEQPVTPLCCAASVGALECVRILVEAGAAIEFGSEPNTVSALHHAVLVNAVDVVRYLVSKKANVNFGQVFSETPVHIAAAEGYVECLKILLENGGNVVLKGTNGMTPLHLAAKDGASETVALLVKAGSDVNAPNNMGRTPLHLAALAQSLECVELLLKAGAKPNAEDVDLKTPLHSAIVKAARNCDCVKALLDAGADPNKQDNSGFTPLHLAVINEFSICVQLLLEGGGDVTIKTNGGRSVLTYMVRKTPDTLGKLRDMFNQSVSLTDDVNDREAELHLNFKVLKPPSNKHEMLLFTNLIQAGQRRLLNHPLCESFLYLKWQKIRKFFWFNLVFYGLFVVTLTWYIMNVFRERCLEEECNPDLNKTNCFVECQGKGLWEVDEREAFTRRLDISISWWAMVVLAFVLMAKELFQVVQNFKEYYRTLENLLQISILVLVIFLVNLKYPGSYLPLWKYHIAAITVFAAWVELMFLIGRFPQYGLYIQMFIIVMKDFAQFFVAYFAIIIAFSMSFAVIFFRHDMFKNPLEGIITTLVMMTGEYEYSDAIFFRTNKNDEVETLEFQGTSHVIFVVFLLIMAIIMMNLLVGMAVNDIQGLQKTAKLERLVRQTELIAHIESTVLSNLFSFLPSRITRFLHNSALLVPESYRWSLYIRCNDPRDKRLPREIVEAAYKLARSTRNIETRYREIRSPANATMAKRHQRRGGLDRNMPHQRSGLSQGHAAPEASVWTEESHEHIEQIKQMLSVLQLDKEYLERKVEETEEAVVELKNQLIPLVNEILEILQLHRRRSAIRRRSRPRNSDDEDDGANLNIPSRPHSIASTAPVEHSTLSSHHSSSSVPLDLRQPVVDSSPENSSVH